MKENNIYEIEYVSAKGETTERTIIPVFIPGNSAKTIDVSSLTEDEQSEMLNLSEEYAEYIKLQRKQMFTFEDWAMHAKDREIKPKWRNLTKANITEK